MDRKYYFNLLNETSRKSLPLIEKELIKISRKEKALFEKVTLFNKLKQKKQCLKPTMFRLAYELVGGKHFNRIIPIAAAFEALNLSSYQANSALDNKLGSLMKIEKDGQFISSMISRELTTILLDKAEKNISKLQYILIQKCLSKSNLAMYKAQHYDINILKVDNIKNYTNKKDFMNDYYKRCFYGSGIFSGQVLMAGAMIGNSKYNKYGSLIRFGEIFGTALQMINDLADFFPNKERSGKIYQDEYSDIKNGRLTLPIYELLTNHIDSYDEIKRLAFNNTQRNRGKISEIIKKTKITNLIREITRKSYNDAKHSLMSIPDSNEKQLLFAMLSILMSNKFFYRSKL